MPHSILVHSIKIGPILHSRKGWFILRTHQNDSVDVKSFKMSSNVEKTNKQTNFGVS